MSNYESAIAYYKIKNKLPLTIEMLKIIDPNTDMEIHQEFIDIASDEQKEFIIKSLLWNRLYEKIYSQKHCDNIFQYILIYGEMDFIINFYNKLYSRIDLIKKHCVCFDGVFNINLVESINNFYKGENNGI